jgi:hypothetical protein
MRYTVVRFETEAKAEAYIRRVFLDDPQSDFDRSDFRIVLR